MLNPPLNTVKLSKNDLQEYSRHIILDNIGINGQKRIKTARLLFIGAGGLAASSLLYLVTSGINAVGIIDEDIISRSNLHRQILYRHTDIGKLKVDIIKEKIQQIKPDCQVFPYPYKLTKTNAFSIIKYYDIIIDTCDNFKTRYIIDETCYALHKVHIYGAIAKFQGQISVFNYKGGIKYSDLYPRSLKLFNNSCNTDGVTGFLTGIIGLLQANEAIKIITGIGQVLSGKLLAFNALYTSFNIINIKTKKIDYYKKINNNDTISNNITEIEFKNILRLQNKLLIDVRQHIEFEQDHISKSINIPLKKLTTKNTRIFLQKYCLNKKLILYCNNFTRSSIACKIFDRYKITYSVFKEGIDMLKNT